MAGMKIPKAFMKAFLENKEVMKAIEEVIQDQIKSNLEITETSYICMYGKGETNIFGEEITFCVKYDKFGTWKWKCTAIHTKSDTVIKVNHCETQKIAVQYALKSLIEKLTKSGNLKSKAFTKGIMSELKKKGWTMPKIMQTVQQQMQKNKKKTKKKKNVSKPKSKL
eukprot:CAMPEP_0201595474 /NCGR_PEP_ID=MMETSP0190_2-20130828/192467_1 /ASSEMBLY_ACC=CAM_ASM_000263 /TAXON_ID=37353 /ORGANISM="Rosalina sp." /LENGTH=166 /DNA_ID=CAMNT_0048055477 /DNA_START=10 /DNA_END=510 /DNA_ORIENTATION=+